MSDIVATESKRLTALTRLAGRGTSVEFADVDRTFGSTRALDGLSLAIEPGELLALLGPSGCGKTTALRMLAGFDRPDRGAVLVDGRDISRVPVNKRDMGMVFQSYSLFPTMSAADNIAFGLRLRKEAPAARRSRAAELLELVGLTEHGKKFPHQLSGGQQQRVALARALAISPRVLLLDEPLSALDAKVREQLRDEIRRIQLELGVTTVFVTHDQEEALSMADRVGVMREGRLEQCAAPAELYDRPATPFVAEFVGTMNHLSGTTEAGGRVRVGAQVLPADGDAPAGNLVTVLVRPEAVIVQPDDRGDSVVVVATFRGSTVRLRLLRSDGTELLADVASHRAGELGPGGRVSVTLLNRPVLLA
jgi:putative spermidine/putrescine transport system ATP-binding protein